MAGPCAGAARGAERWAGLAGLALTRSAPSPRVPGLSARCSGPRTAGGALCFCRAVPARVLCPGNQRCELPDLLRSLKPLEVFQAVFPGAQWHRCCLGWILPLRFHTSKTAGVWTYTLVCGDPCPRGLESAFR